MDQPSVNYDQEADASAFDAIKRAEGEKFQTGFYAKAEDLKPGLYAGRLVETKSRVSLDYGPQIRVVLDILGTVDIHRKAVAEWKNYGRFSVLFSMTKPKRIGELVETYARLGAVRYDGQELATGGDLLRCATPRKFVNVRVMHSDEKNRNYIAYINTPFYDYSVDLPVDEPAEKQPVTSGEVSSYLSDVPPFD